MKGILSILLFLFLVSCSSHLLKYEEKDFADNGNYQEEIKVEKIEEPIVVKPVETKKKLSKKIKKPSKKKIKKKKAQISKIEKAKKTYPFQPNERVGLTISYLGMTAGEIVFETMPMVRVNNELAYFFRMRARTRKLFEMVYKVENEGRSYVDSRNLLPISFELDVNESKKVRQARAIFDNKKGEVKYWEKLFTKKDGLKKIEEKWPIKKKDQNAYSAQFLFRNFPYKQGEIYTIWVSHNKKSIKVDYKALRREEIETNFGKMKTIVVKPTLYEDGKIQPKTDVTFWLTDDDRKLIVKLKADLKFGSLKGYLTDYQP